MSQPITNYQHQSDIDSIKRLPAGKVVCIGRNYAAHAKELGNPVPKQPVIFIKPSTSLCHWNEKVYIPAGLGECHHEVELAILIKERLTNLEDTDDVVSAIAGVSLALDLTLRDLQQSLKSQGHPWELAKAFDGACPVSNWVELPSAEWLEQAEFSLSINGELRQTASAQLMLWPVIELIRYISQSFTLQPGDMVLTGTPEGVAALQPGDKLQASLSGLLTITSKVEYYGG